MPLSRRGVASAGLLGLLAFGRHGSSRASPAPEPPKPDPAGPDPLAGSLLAAAPEMGDSRFARAVVLLLQHDAAGALGVVINRPIGPRPVAELLDAIGAAPDAARGTITLFAGGPVQPDSVFVVHGADYRRPSTTALGAQIAVTPPREVLRDIGAGRGPRQCAVMLGYAGWGPSQLESELLLRAWTASPATAELVFDMDRAKVWQAVTSHRSISL